jgi:hypothetical protein
MHRLDIGQLANTVPLDPGEELARGQVIGHARVPVADRGREELEEAPDGMTFMQLAFFAEFTYISR